MDLIKLCLVLFCCVLRESLAVPLNTDDIDHIQERQQAQQILDKLDDGVADDGFVKRVVEHDWSNAKKVDPSRFWKDTDELVARYGDGANGDEFHKLVHDEAELIRELKAKDVPFDDGVKQVEELVEKTIENKASRDQDAKASPCNAITCQNGGSCVEETGKCLCPYAYSGSYCEKTSPCNANPCLNGGSCLQHTGKCLCFWGYAGSKCEKTPTCDWKQMKDGEGGGEIKVGKFNTYNECVKECKSQSITYQYPGINGATVRRSDKTCWCEIGMTRIESSDTYNTCIFTQLAQPTRPPYDTKIQEAFSLIQTLKEELKDVMMGCRTC